MKRAFAWLIPMMLMAGCTQLDDAKQAAEDAKAQLDEARQDAAEAKERFDRVKSSTIVRTERADVRIEAVYAEDNTSVSFRVNATRDGNYTIPRANLTSAPAIAIILDSGTEFSCDPLDCIVKLGASDPILWGFADIEDRVTFGEELSRADAQVGVTTAVGDVTE